jgi:hypothetical protein
MADSSPARVSGAPGIGGLNLLFIENTDEAFVQTAREYIAQGTCGVAFLPFGDRAQRISEALRTPEFSTCEFRSVPAPGDLILITHDNDQALGATLLQLLDLDRGVIVAPKTASYSQNRPLFLISIPKAGTHLLYELARAFGYVDGVVLTSRGAAPGHWYCVEYSNSHTDARHFFIDSVRESPFGNREHPFMRSPAIFIYRNPRDILVSEANYYHQDGNAAFAGYLNHLSSEQRLLRLINDPWLLSSFRDRMAGFVAWLDIPNVIPISFEELVGPAGGGDVEIQRRLIWSLQLKLQVPGNPADFAGRVFNPASPTFFAGKIGGWRNSFTPPVEQAFDSLPQDFSEAFGYARPADGEVPVYPARGDEFRRRAITLGRADFQSVPVTREYDFFGFNLVHFQGTMYAISQSLGPVDLTTTAPEELAGMPRAASVDELKFIILTAFYKLPEPLGDAAFSINGALAARLGDISSRQQSLETLLEQMRLDQKQDDASGLRLLGSHRGFNFVQEGVNFYGVRQALGEIDWSVGPDALYQRHGPRDFFLGESAGEVRAKVDVILALETLEAERLAIQKLQADMLEQQNYAAKLGELTETVAGDEARFSTEIAESQRQNAAHWSQLGDAVAEAEARFSAEIAESQRRNATQWSELSHAVAGAEARFSAEIAATARQHTFKLAELSDALAGAEARFFAELEKTTSQLGEHSQALDRIRTHWLFRLLLSFPKNPKRL